MVPLPAVQPPRAPVGVAHRRERRARDGPGREPGNPAITVADQARGLLLARERDAERLQERARRRPVGDLGQHQDRNSGLAQAFGRVHVAPRLGQDEVGAQGEHDLADERVEGRERAPPRGRLLRKPRVVERLAREPGYAVAPHQRAGEVQRRGARGDDANRGVLQDDLDAIGACQRPRVADTELRPVIGAAALPGSRGRTEEHPAGEAQYEDQDEPRDEGGAAARRGGVEQHANLASEGQDAPPQTRRGAGTVTNARAIRLAASGRPGPRCATHGCGPVPDSHRVPPNPRDFAGVRNDQCPVSLPRSGAASARVTSASTATRGSASPGCRRRGRGR